MEKIKVKIRGFFKNNTKEIIVVGIILLLAAFLRLYRISEYMHFMGDEGRDMIVVRNLLVNKDLILIGPGTSVGNMYLGPLYYYLIAPALLLFDFEPVGPAIMVALLGVGTVLLTYLLTKKWFGIRAGVIAAFFSAISYLFIKYSIFSWNPNVLPFFSILSVFLLSEIKEKKSWLIIPSLASFAFVLQSHYMGIFLFPVLLTIWIYKLKNDKAVKRYLVNTLLGVLLFLLLMSPLLIFDLRHGMMNYNALMVYLNGLGGSRTYSTVTLFDRVLSNFRFMVGEVVGSKFDTIITGGYSFLLVIGMIYLSFYHKNKYAVLTTIIWFVIAVLGLTIYGGRIISHYYGYAFAVIPIIVGAVVGDLMKRKYLGIIFAFLLMSPVIYFAVINSNLNWKPNRLVQKAEAVADKIIEESEGKELNLAVLSNFNYEDGYQYFVEKKGYVAKDIDPSKFNETVTDQLFVVCELEEENCKPTSNPNTQIANFGWSKIVGKWQIENVILYKLTHIQ